MPPSIRRYEIPCTPPAWARGGHAQTLLGHLLPSRGPKIRSGDDVRSRRIGLADGDRLAVLELPGTSGVRVHLLHGLAGDANSEYVRRTAAALRQRGHAVWAVNHRCCGEGRGLASRPYHAGRSEDLQAVLAASRADDPDGIHLVVGFSLSGNLALLHAAQRLEPQPHGIVVVNPSVDAERASKRIGEGLNRLYELRFIWRLRRTVRERERDGLAPRPYDIPLGTSLIEFDDLLTAPECGFASGLDYYRRCSSLGRLPEIATPTVIVHALDDPFVDAAVYADVEIPGSVLLHLEPAGGHVGYLARRGIGWSRWLDGALLHYVEELVRLAREA